MSFISRGSARFNWHSYTVASLKVPVMIVYDMVMNALDTKWFPQHNIAGLISSITFIVLFQSGEASTVEGNKHTHTQHKKYFFLKDHTQNVVEKLVLDPFIKNQNWEYLWTNNLKCYKVCLDCMSMSKSKYIKSDSF